MNLFKNRKFRLAISWLVFVVSWIGLFASPFFLKDEPIVVLSLSWFALILTSFDSISTNTNDNE